MIIAFLAAGLIVVVVVVVLVFTHRHLARCREDLREAEERLEAEKRGREKGPRAERPNGPIKLVGGAPALK